MKVSFCLLTNPMGRVLFENLTATQLVKKLWNQRVSYYVRKSMPVVRVLSQMTLTRTRIPYFFTIHVNNNLLSASRSPK
jgi:hypothetical protein